MTNTKTSAALVAVCGLLTASLSAAQDVVLEQIVVTAQKRTQDLTEVPISIAVVGAETLEKTGVRSMREVAEFVPNMTVSSGNDSSTAVRIRGVGALTRNIGFDTRVGVYLDGVYLGQSPAQNLDIVDLQRVEVLRGPQGTLFGKNTVAGAINLITQKPDDDLSFTFYGEYGNFNSHRATAILNTPLSERSALRLTVSDNNRDGFVENLTTGTDHNERDGTTVRAQYRYTGDRVEFGLAADYLESSRTSFTGEAVSDFSGSVSPDPLAPNRFEISNNVDNDEEREVAGVSATFDVDIGDGYTFRSISAYRDSEVQRIQDTDHSALSLLSVNYPDEYSQFTQEFQFLSPDDTPFTYVIGAYYYDQRGETERRILIGSDLGLLLGAAGSPLAPAGPLFEGAGAGTIADLDTTSWAAYFDAAYALTDKLTVGFGARYTSEEKDVDFSLTTDVVDAGVAVVPVGAVFGLALGPVSNGQTVARTEDRDDYSDFSPSISLRYALNDRASVYAKYSSAFKSGGFNVDFISQDAFASGIDFDTETVDAFEIGIKGSALENRLQYNLAAYQMDFEDYQLNQFISLGGGTTAIAIRNAAEVRSRGVEAEVNWLAADRLLVQGSVGTNDATFERFPGGASARSPAGAGADLAGNSLPVAPELSAAVAIQHNYPLKFANADWVTRIDWTYTDDYFTTPDNVRVLTPISSVPFGFVDSYDLVNARIGIESDDGWSVFAWGRNLFDEEYTLRSTADILNTVVDMPGDPRTYGIEFTYEF